jgi:hypothetical protein
MGFGQKPVLALGVIDMRNMLDYTKKWDGTERIGVDTSSYTFYDSFTSDGFFVHNNATEVILPSEYTTWTSVSMRAPSLLTAFWVTDTQNVLQPTNFELANRDKYNGSEFAWCNFVLHVPNALLNNYLSIWENMISGTQSLSIIGDADLII